MQVILEKQFHNQLGGVEGALEREMRGLLRDGHKPSLHGPLPTNLRQDHWPSPKASCCVPGPENLPYIFFLVFKSEN